MKKLLFAFALLFSITTFAMIETVTPPQYQAVKKPSLLQKLLLKKALKKVDSKDKMSTGEIFASVVGIALVVAGFLVTAATTKLVLLILGMVFLLWALFSLLKKL